MTGDAVFNFLQIEVYLKYLKMSRDDFDNIFIPKRSLTYKLKVKNRLAIVTNEWNQLHEQPADLEPFIQNLYAKHPDFDLRIFIRPSGTEDVVRVHMEATTDHQIATVRKEIDEFILKHHLINAAS